MGPGYFQRTSKHPRLCCYVFGVPPLSYDELPLMLEQAKSIKAFQVEFFISSSKSLESPSSEAQLFGQITGKCTS